MEFTKENVEKYWNILNANTSAEDKKIADQFLIAFKVNYNKVYF